MPLHLHLMVNKFPLHQVLSQVFPKMQPELPEERRQPAGHAALPGGWIHLPHCFVTWETSFDTCRQGGDLTKPECGGKSARHIRQHVRLTIPHFHIIPFVNVCSQPTAPARFVHNNSKHGRRAKRLDPTEGKYYNCMLHNRKIHLLQIC